MVETADKQVVGILETVFDPEVPVLNIVEMGIVRDARIREDGSVYVSIIPTYTGCPAMNAIEMLVRKSLADAGYQSVHVETLFHQEWTTDWMTREARNKLREYGIAPPAYSSDVRQKPPCPFCGSDNTRITSEFGSTACKSLYFCDACVQPFEYFKCH